MNFALSRSERIDEFREAMRRDGLEPPEIIEPESFIRFQTNGRPHDKAGWCKLFPDMAGGVYGDHRAGFSATWQATKDRPQTPREKAEFRKWVAAAKAEAETEQRKRQQQSAGEARAILKAAEGDPATHPYSIAKRVSFGILLKRGEWPQRGWRDALLVPLYDAEGAIWTVEAISEDGSKDFLSGGRKRGCFYPFGKIRGADTVLIGEGVATVATVVETTGLPGAAAMDAGNLEPVAKAIRRINPECRIVLLADNDIRADESNVGVDAATAAAAAVSGVVAIPELNGAKCDWWDIWNGQGQEGVSAAIESILSGDSPSHGLELLCAADIEPEAVDWLWPGWLAAGKLHVLAGAPGTGKTMIALALAAAVSAGRRWPDHRRATAGDVLIWSGEDSPADTLVPRLLAAGANLESVRFIGDITGPEGVRPFDPAADVDSLRARMAELVRRGRAPRLLLVDPIVSAVLGDSHKNAEVRRSLAPLVALAGEFRCAVLGISHFSKGTAGRDPVERVSGSLAFGALARIVLAAAKLPEDHEAGCTHMLARAKNNIGPDSGGFVYNLGATEIPEKGIEAYRIEWGSMLDGTARELLAQAEAVDDPEQKSETQEAAEWLADLLTDGAMPVKEVFRKGKAEGFSERTVRRAKERLGVRSTKGEFSAGVWRWHLPADTKAPPSTPLDAQGAPSQEKGALGALGDSGAPLEDESQTDRAVSADGELL